MKHRTPRSRLLPVHPSTALGLPETWQHQQKGCLLPAAAKSCAWGKGAADASWVPTAWEERGRGWHLHPSLGSQRDRKGMQAGLGGGAAPGLQTPRRCIARDGHPYLQGQQNHVCRPRTSTLLPGPRCQQIWPVDIKKTQKTTPNDLHCSGGLEIATAATASGGWVCPAAPRTVPTGRVCWSQP